jgi:hypothetical protein
MCWWQLLCASRTSWMISSVGWFITFM